MARITCNRSGITFNCDHLPISLCNGEYSHPVFFLPQKKLLGLYQKYRHEELGEVDSYLVFLAYLNSTGLLEWRVPARFTERSSQLVANNFDSLVSICEKMNRLSIQKHFAHISISPETSSLGNVHYWILSWESTFEEFSTNNAAIKAKKEILELEDRLEHLCKDANRNEIMFASRLASWAEKAGNFPRFPVTVAGNTTTCAEYWKALIRKCVKAESIFAVPSSDLLELQDHCQDNIDAGTIYGFNLFKILKEGIHKQASFLGLGNIEFKILPSNSSVESANKEAIIASVTEIEEPNPLNYPSRFAYLKAKMAWELKQSQAAITSQEEILREEIIEELSQEGESEEEDE